ASAGSTRARLVAACDLSVGGIQTNPARGRVDCRAGRSSLSTSLDTIGYLPFAHRVGVRTDRRRRPMIVPRAALLGILLALGAAPARAQSSGDTLCGSKSTPDTCIISGNFTVMDGSILTFSRPNVVVRGTLTVAFAGVCSLEPASACVSDAKCTAPGRCLRTGRVSIQAAGTLGVDTTGQILARSQGIVGDVVGPDGGSITLVGHDVSVAGTLGASAEAPAGVTAGRGGGIVLQA